MWAMNVLTGRYARWKFGAIISVTTSFIKYPSYSWAHSRHRSTPVTQFACVMMLH